MNILYLSPWFPFPPTNGSELRINALLRGLAAEHEVTLISFQRRPISDAGLAEARALCREVQLIPWHEFNPKIGRALAGFFSLKPRSVVDTYSPEMADAIRAHVRSGLYQAIFVSELGPAAYATEFGHLSAIIDDLELGVIAQQAEDELPIPQRARRNLMWAKQRAYVRELLPRFAACTVVSEKERQLLRQVAPDYHGVEVIPNCINLPDYDGVHVTPLPNTLIFAGAFTYRVNYEAMAWFLAEVYPLVRNEVPDVHLVITGDHAGLPLPSLDGVTLAGFVDDIKSAVASAAVSIAPILQGGGTRLKILEAMALRTPVVATTKGAEGLQVTAGEHLLIADTPEAFAEAIIQLLQSESLRQQLASNAHDLVTREYNWSAVMPRLLDLVQRVANPASVTI